MKKLISAALLAALLSAAGTSAAMDSKTLMNDPDRYRIIETDKTSVTFVDMDTLLSTETMDYPSSLQNIYCTLYRMDYRNNPSDMNFQKGNLVDTISEYSVRLHGNKRTRSFRVLDSEKTAVYDSKGNKRMDSEGKSLSLRSIKHAFITLFLMDETRITPPMPEEANK